MLLLLPPLVLGSVGALWLPSFFSDNMVLQREKPIPVWGTAAPGSSVTVTLGDQKAKVKAKADGSFVVNLKPMTAGGPYDLSVSDGENHRKIGNVLVGEVWICSGQSNMGFEVKEAHFFDQYQAGADPNVRMFSVQQDSKDTPQRDVTGQWVPAAPDTVGSFSAVGYAFGVELYNRLHVPIGLINTSWGGTPAESWTSREAMLKDPQTAYMVQNYVEAQKDIVGAMRKYREAIVPWHAKAYPQDADNIGLAQGWAGPDSTNWKDITVPGAWEDTAKLIFDGVLWLKREVVLPDNVYAGDWTLHLGPIDDTDTTYFAGEQVGRTTIDVDNPYAVPRVYKVPARLLKPGANMLAIRVFDTGGAGGLTGTAEDVYLESPDGTRISLAGQWKYKIESEFVQPSDELLQTQPARPITEGDGWVPGGLYNAMIAPLIPYGVRGSIWYQGESNADRAKQYETLFPMMITDWRKRWGTGDFPFYFVQLANYMERHDEPTESNWAELREAQRHTLKLANTGMAVAIEIGEADDIHPKNKRDVGKRLAQWALAKDYGITVPFSGPLYKTHKVEGSKVRIRFTSTDGGIATQDGKAIRGFEIAGDDHKFVWASATVEGDSVIVWSDSVAKPTSVRYGWADNPDVNLCNAAGLPASPFRTDNWSHH